MELDYSYSFEAGAWVSASVLKGFLCDVQAKAEAMGFGPCVVIESVFDTPDGRAFARRLTPGLLFESPALAENWVLPEAFSFNPGSSEARLAPDHGVVVVIADEFHNEVLLGFLRYPTVVAGIKTGLEGWHFRGFVSSPDPRYRQLVALFKEAGYLNSEVDEFRNLAVTADPLDGSGRLSGSQLRNSCAPTCVF